MKDIKPTSPQVRNLNFGAARVVELPPPRAWLTGPCLFAAAYSRLGMRG